MERAAWTDERIDDFAQRVELDIRELRTEMRAGFREVRAEIAGLRMTVIRFGGCLLLAQFGTIAALIARG